MRTVAVPVHDLLARHEALGFENAVLDVRVGRVDAGVQDGDLGALAVVALGPCLRGVDLRHGVLERGLHPAVEPELGDAVVQRTGRGGAGDVVPEGPGGVLLGLQRSAVDALQGANLLGAARGGGQ